MAFRGKTLKVEVPTQTQESPRLVRVAAIAISGFAIGIVWPWLAGVELVPRPPSDSAAKTEALQDAGTPAEPPPPNEVEPAAPKPADRVQVGDIAVTSCRDAEAKAKSDCDTPELLSVLTPHLLALSVCDAAKGVLGTLSLGFDVDFADGHIKNLKTGKSTTIPESLREPLLDCSQKQMSGVSLVGVEHKYSSYAAFVLVDFKNPAPGEGDAGSDVLVAASGKATVSWQVALIRDKPHDGGVVARVMSGTRVIVTARQGDWYRVKYDAKGREGWVYRTAIGL